MKARPLLVVFLTVLIDLLGFGIVIPLLPVYSKAYGASELELGLLFACFSGMQFFCAPFWGRISDRIGRRPVLLGGLCGTALAYLLFAAADSMTLLFVSRLLAGFFGANVSTAHAYIADVTEAGERTKGMGIIGAAFGLGFTIGPLVGGELARWSLRAPGLFAAGLSLSAAAFGWYNLPEPARHVAGARTLRLELLRSAFRLQPFARLLLLYFLAIAAFSCFEAMFIRYGLARFPDEFGLPARVEHATLDEVIAAAPIAGRYIAFVGVVSALVQGGLIRRLAPRFGEWRLIVGGPLLLGLGIGIVACAPLLPLDPALQWLLVIVGCLLMPLGLGVNSPSLTSLLSQSAPPAEQGAYMGLVQSAASFARMSAPPAAGLCFVLAGPSAPFFAAAAMLAAAAWIALGAGGADPGETRSVDPGATRGASGARTSPPGSA
jgi:multidrug resistance protein